MKNYLLPFLAISSLFASCGGVDVQSYPEACYKWEFDSAHANVIQFVDPFIGTGGHGHTFPGATAPFGMVQLSPDTRIDGSWDGCSGYHHDDNRIYGFSHTHLSGTGCSDYGDIMFMPGSGQPYFTPGSDSTPGYSSTFTHDLEHASAGYYSVQLDNNVLCELTASPRVGVHRYSFNDQIDPWIVLDMSHRDEVLECDFEVVDDYTIRGKRFSKAWATNQQLWFYAEFSEPFTWKLYSEGKEFTADSAMPKDLKVVLSFSAQQVEVKCALSPVSCDNAKMNLDVETVGMKFDDVRAKTERHWNSELSCIEIETADETKKRIFYTALYHCFIAPNVYCDVNGDYQGMDHKVYRDTVHQRYTVFSLWDTYRALHPLFTIVQQKRTNDFINTFLQQYKESGRLPVWELSSNETDCMIGNHSIPVIVDAWMKGINDFDTLLAYEAIKSAANEDHFGLAGYKNYGYVPAEGESESVSRTLEYAYDDWCVYQAAKRMSDEDGMKYYGYRSNNWRNLFDPETHFFRARYNNGFVTPFRGDEVNNHYTEANAYQYSLAVQHDMFALLHAHGGRNDFEVFLDSLFNASSATTGREQADITGLIGQYAHGNEPSHHMAFLYNYSGQPYKTQRLVTRIANEMYHDTPDGLSGNEDCGQMSAWYVLNAMGIYPVNPCGGKFDFGIPQVDTALIHFENGHDLKLYGNPTPLDKGEAVQSPHTSFSAMLFFGSIQIQTYPDTSVDYIADDIRPVDYSRERITAPIIVNGHEMTFVGSKKIELSCSSPSVNIFYSVNGEIFKPYTTPFTITDNSTIQTFASLKLEASYQAAPSDTAVAHFFKAPSWKSISIRNAFAPQYSAGGERALIDGLTGTTNFRTGLWQGYEGVDLIAVVDLGKTMDIDSVVINFLCDQRSWIFPPRSVTICISDSPTFLTATSDNTTILSGGFPQETEIKRISQVGKNGRYVHIIAKSYGTCPTGHLGEGHAAWLFADEITIITK